MKKFSRLFALVFASLAFVACGNDDQDSPIDEQPNPEEQVRTIEIAARLDVTTRAALTDQIAMNWEGAEELFSVIDESGKSLDIKSMTATDGVVLTVDVPKESTALKVLFAPSILTPASMQSTIAAEATQLKAGSTEGLSITLVSPEWLSLEGEVERLETPLELASSMLRYMVYSSDGAFVDENVLSVSLDADDSVALHGHITFDLSDNSYEVAGGVSFSKVTLATPYQVGAEKDTAKGIYMELAPAVSQGAKWVVATDVAKYTFEVTDEVSFQMGAVHTAYFDLKNATSRLENDAQVVTYDASYLTTSLQMSALGGVQDMGYYLASVNGVQDTVNYDADYYTQISFESTDSEGAPVEWVTCEIQNYNHPVLTVAKNESTEGRFCTVKIIYTPSTKEYAVENPIIATIEVAQNGATATHTLHYQWFGDAVVTIPGAGFSGVKGLGYFLAYLDGSATAVADAEAIEPFFKTVEVVSDADWCVATVVGGNFNNIELSAIGANPSTTEERTATITATFKGDTDTYTMTPDNTAFTIRVVQQPSKAAGLKSELYYTTANLSVAPMIVTAGVSDKDLGYFFAMVDGVQTDDGGSKYFASLEVTSSASWMSARIGGNHIYLTVEPSTEGWRKGVISISYPESDQEVSIVGGNPVVTIEVVQMLASSDGLAAVYTFGNDPNNIVLRKDMTVGKDGCGSTGVTWMSVYKIVGGAVDPTRDNNFTDEAHALSYSYVDADGNSIDWLSANVGGDWLNYEAAANTTGEARVGYIYVHPAVGAGQAYEGYDIIDPCLVVKVLQSAE